MRLVEAVPREGRQYVENLFGFLPFVAARDRALDEWPALFSQDFRLFLSHGLAQQVGAAQGIACHFACHLHDLFLVHDDAIGAFEVLLQARVRVRDRCLAIFRIDKLIDIVHGAWPIQCVQSDEVFDAGRFCPLKDVLHAGRFELEDRGALALSQYCIGFGVVLRDIIFL